MSMISTIERIPIQLDKIKNNKDSIHTSLLNYLEAYPGIKKVVIIASGTSYNAAFTTRRFAEEVTNLSIELHYPNMFVNYSNQSLWSSDALYIFVSQGGKTKLVHEALEIAKSNNLLNMSITESLDSPIATLSDLSLEMGSENEEYVFRTLGYSATCATLCWIYTSLAKLNDDLTSSMEQELVKDYSNILESLPIIKNNTLEWYEKHKSFLLNKGKFIFSGTNDLWSVAQEADIKFMEMLPIISNSFELEELIHGPQNAFDESTGYFILTRSGEDSDKARRIANFINDEITPCVVIGDDPKTNTDFMLAAKSKYFSSMEYITFFQVLAYKLATDKGRDLRKSVYPQVVNYINKSITQ